MSVEGRMSALRAMANQTASPLEAAIAREKLARYASFTSHVITRVQQEQIDRQRQIEAEESERRRLVRKFEVGGFTGVTIRAGGAGIEVAHR